MSDQDKEQKPGFWQVVFSTLAAFLGVQSNKNRERDFKHGNFLAYVVSGLIFTVIFIFTVITVVRMVLQSRGM
ncbi:MAG: DUF2970 domain-containing protein [Gammaproteobacteria bacterium]|nr:MAG: DUF2970 domain-containing protein [Gammaproteobacteria bacterium]